MSDAFFSRAVEQVWTLDSGDCGGEAFALPDLLEPADLVRPKHIGSSSTLAATAPMIAVVPAATARASEPSENSLSARKRQLRAGIAAAAADCLKRWRCPQDDLAAVGEVSRTIVALGLKQARPLNIEPYLMVDDDRALQFLGALTDFIRDRKRGVVAHEQQFADDRSGLKG